MSSRVRASFSLLAATLVMLAAWPAQAATTYKLDPAKSSLSFTFVQAGAKSQGKFNKFDATFVFAPDQLDASKLEVVVQVDSLDTTDKERDEILRGADLFNVAKFPQAKFTSTKLTALDGGRYEVAGKLTIRDVTRDVRIPLTFKTANEGGKPVGTLSGSFVIKRLDFGVGQGEWKSTEWVANDVTISFSLRMPALSAS